MLASMKRRMAKKTARTDDAGAKRKALQRFRDRFDLSLEDLADQSGLSRSMLSKFELGQRDLSPEAWARVLAAIQKLRIEEAKRKAERAKAEQTAAKLDASLFGSLFGAQQSAKAMEAYQRALEEADREVKKWKAEDYVKKVIQERDLFLAAYQELRAAYEEMNDELGKFEKNLDAQNLTPEQKEARIAELMPIVTPFQRAAEKILAIREGAKV